MVELTQITTIEPAHPIVSTAANGISGSGC